MILPLEIALKVAITIVAGLAVTSLLRGQSAAVRHWVLAVAVAAAAAVPLLEAAVPAWQLRVSRAPVDSGAPAAAVPMRIPPRELPAAAAPGVAGRAGTPADSAVAQPLSWRQWLAAIWLAGAALGVASLGLGLAHLRRIAARATVVADGPWRRACDAFAGANGVRRPIILLQSSRQSLLVTWGARRPRIILPAGAHGWSEDRIRVVLAHEIAHIRRGDWLLQLLAQLLQSVYWFNPLVWIASARLRRESELACDDAVLGAGVDGSEYAAHLVDIARTMHTRRGSWWPAPAIVGTSYFERRITAMLTRNTDRAPLSLAGRLTTFAAMLALAGVIASAQTSYARLSGTVLDSTGAYVPNATIVLTHVDSGTKHEVRSGPTGAFELVGLVSGEYQLETSVPGFAGYREALTVSPGQIVTRALVLQLGSLQETISVVDDGGAGIPVVHRGTAPPAKACPESSSARGGVGGNIMTPKKIADLRPRYPQNLRNQSEGGIVRMQAVIGPDGLMKSVEVTSTPNQEMADAAVEAVRQWEYTPTLLNCIPQDVHMSVLVNFMGRR